VEKLLTASMRNAAPIRRKKGKKDFAFLLSMAIKTPSTKNSRMFNFTKKGDRERNKKNINPMISNTRANSRFFLEGITFKSSNREKDINRA
jgi:hypothetical protein